MKPQISVYESREMLARAVADKLLMSVNQAAEIGNPLHIALSGGSTPEILFRRLIQPPYLETMRWDTIHFFWGDERCVPPDHAESNYGMAKAALLEHINIPPENIHRIHGEAAPQAEARRYEKEIRRFVSSNRQGYPRFDWIFLGMGTDGHTASLFPGAPALEERKALCSVAEHPDSGQKRISMTLPVINAGKTITFLVTGSEKAERVSAILNRKEGYPYYPAARVEPSEGIAIWFLDQMAAAKL